jgi:hypothetical protein
MPPRPNAAQVRRSLDRLRALRPDPAAHATFAAELLEGEPGAEVLAPVLDVLASHPVPGARDALVRQYRAHDSSKHDRGGFLRTAIVQALRYVVLPADAPLLERAITTVEATPQDPAGCAALRAAALVAMVDLDPELAGFHATARLAAANNPALTSHMTGEPAVTAARVLGALGQQLPLLLSVQAVPDLHGEVYAACLCELRDVPGAVLAPLLEAAAEDRREAVQLGLCDLLVNHAPTEPVVAAARSFLRATFEIDLYRYFVASAVAERRAELLALIAESAREEFDRERLLVIQEQLGIRRGDRAVDEALRIVTDRLARPPGPDRSSG